MTVVALNGKAINWLKPPKANALVLWSKRDMYGRKVIGSLRTIALLDKTDALARKKFGTGIVVIQPSYNKGVAASAGTHDFDACLDVYIPGVSWAEQQRFFRANGWGAYWRKPPKFGNHIHMFALPVPEGSDRSDDYRAGGFKVGRFVDGGWTTLGRKVYGAQVTSYYLRRDALASNLKDNSWFPASITKTVFDLPAWLKAKRPVPVEKPSKPWINVSFLNTWGNSVKGGRTFIDRLPDMVKTSVAGSPALAGFSEVRESQVGSLTKAMNAKGYVLVEYVKTNMLVAYARKHSTIQVQGSSFSLFSKQDGGNKEGVLRVKIKVDGSRAQVGFVHLDVDSPASYKRSNVKETYAALKRFGRTLPNWKTRTVIIGDWNWDHEHVTSLLGPLGFKHIPTGGTTIDAGYVGKDRRTRGGAATKTQSDHKRILVRIGRV